MSRTEEGRQGDYKINSPLFVGMQEIEWKAMQVRMAVTEYAGELSLRERWSLLVVFVQVVSGKVTGEQRIQEGNNGEQRKADRRWNQEQTGSFLRARAEPAVQGAKVTLSAYETMTVQAVQEAMTVLKAMVVLAVREAMAVQAVQEPMAMQVT